MKVKLNLSTEYRTSVFVEDGREPKLQHTVTIDPATLSPATRTKIASAFSASSFIDGTVDITNLNRSGDYSSSKSWAAPFLPSDVPGQTMDDLLIVYLQDQETYYAAKWTKDALELQERFHQLKSRLAAASAKPDNELTWEEGQERVGNAYSDLDGYAEAVALAQQIRERYTAADQAHKERIAQREAENKAREKTEKDQAKAEREFWVKAHGSDHLKKSLAAGYDCQRLYVTERAALEFPGFSVDFNDNARWKNRSCPSEAAMEEAEKYEGAWVVWLTYPVGGVGDEDDYNEPEWDSREAVVVQEFLGKYDLVKEM